MDIPLPLAPEEGYILNSMKHANALTKQRLENLYYGPEKEANIGYTTANTNKINTMLPLEAQELELKNQFYAPNIQSEIAGRNALTNRYNTMTPLEAKELELKNQFYPELTKADIAGKNALAGMRQLGGGMGGLGTGGREQLFYQGLVAKDNPQLKTPEQIYEASNVLAQGGNQLSDGTPLNALSPAARSSLDRITKGATTAQIINQSVRSNQAEAELGVLNDFAQKGLKPYGDTIMGYSPQQVLDTFKKDDKSQKRLGKFIAAQALQYEAAQNRIRLANGQPGVTSTEELMRLSGQMLKTRYPKLSYIAREEATRYMDEALREGLKARNKVGMNPSLIGQGGANKGAPQNPQGMVKMNDPNGVPHYVPQANVQMAMQKYNFTMGQ